MASVLRAKGRAVAPKETAIKRATLLLSQHRDPTYAADPRQHQIDFTRLLKDLLQNFPCRDGADLAAVDKLIECRTVDPDTIRETPEPFVPVAIMFGVLRQRVDVHFATCPEWVHFVQRYRDVIERIS
jgi:hypothetical protein